MRRPVEVTMTIPVRPYEIDFAGVVSNTVYVRWLEDLRMAMTGPPHYLPFVSLLEEGVAPAILSTEISIRRPIRLGDAVVGKAWFSHMDRRRVTTEYELHVNGHLAALAIQRGVFVQLDDFRFVSVPDCWREVYDRTKPRQEASSDLKDA